MSQPTITPSALKEQTVEEILAQLKQSQQAKRQLQQEQEKQVRLKLLADLEDQYQPKESKLGFTIWEMVWFLVKQPVTVIKFIMSILTVIDLIREKTMSDFKTTAASIIQALILLLTLLGVQVAPELKDLLITVAVSGYALVGVIKGYFTKDKPSTPTTGS